MRRLLIAAIALLIVTLPVRAEEPADSIQAVIIAQIDALQANDLPAAFSHASPMIQSKFGNPESFGEMVRIGYPAIWRPARYEMLALTATPRGPLQTVLLQDRQGRFFEAGYEMQQVDGAWRINGVYMKSLPGIGS